MAGDVWLTDELMWPIETFAYLWVEEFLIDHARSPEARAAVQEVADTEVRILDLEVFPVVYRDELYVLLRDELVPAVRRAGRHVTHYARLADMAGQALARYQGHPVRNHTLTLTPTRRWKAARAMFNRTGTFLSARGSHAELVEMMADFANNLDLHELDLSALSPSTQREAFDLLHHELIPDVARSIPLGPLHREWQLAWLQEVVDLAGEALHDQASS